MAITADRQWGARPGGNPVPRTAPLSSLPSQASVCVDLITLFRGAILILDEVDLLLHPLRSELHWPLGTKTSLDFTHAADDASAALASARRPGLGGGGMGPVTCSDGLRWQIPMHLMDAVLLAAGQAGPSVLASHDSQQYRQLLEDLKSRVEVRNVSLGVRICMNSHEFKFGTNSLEFGGNFLQTLIMTSLKSNSLEFARFRIRYEFARIQIAFERICIPNATGGLLWECVLSTAKWASAGLMGHRPPDPPPPPCPESAACGMRPPLWMARRCFARRLVPRSLAEGGMPGTSPSPQGPLHGPCPRDAWNGGEAPPAPPPGHPAYAQPLSP